MSSGSNALFVAGLAQFASIGLFARVGIVYSVEMAIVGLCRSVFGDAVQLDAIHPKVPTRQVLRLTLGGGAIGGLVVVALAIWLNIGWAWTILLALSSPLLVTQDTLRFFSLRSDARRAVVSDSVWAIVLTGACAACWIGAVEPRDGLLIGWSWVLGMGAGLLVLLWNSSSESPAARISFKRVVGQRRDGASEYTVGVVGSTGGLLLLESSSNLAVAGVRAATTILAPLGSAVAGARLTFFRRPSESPPRHQYWAVLGAVLLATISAVQLLYWIGGTQVRLLRLGHSTLPAAFAFWACRLGVQPLLDGQLATGKGLVVTAGRVVGEFAIAVLLLSGVGLSGAGYMLLRCISPLSAGAAVALSGKRRRARHLNRGD